MEALQKAITEALKSINVDGGLTVAGIVPKMTCWRIMLSDGSEFYVNYPE